MLQSGVKKELTAPMSYSRPEEYMMFMFFVVSEVDYFEILLLVHEDEQIITFLLSIFSLIKNMIQKYD